MGQRSQRQKARKDGVPDALAALRLSAVGQLLPPSASVLEDTSAAIVPRILSSEIQWRSRLVEELATLQMLLMQEALRPLKDRAPASLPSIVRELRGLIQDQLKIVQGAPLGTGQEAARTQVRDLLQRHALIAAELRRKGLGQLLDRIHGVSDPAAAARQLPPGVALLMEEIASGAPAQGEASGAQGEASTEDAGAQRGGVS